MRLGWWLGKIRQLVYLAFALEGRGNNDGVAFSMALRWAMGFLSTGFVALLFIGQ